jgi:hypothetical protein
MENEIVIDEGLLLAAYLDMLRLSEDETADTPSLDRFFAAYEQATSDEEKG